MSGDWSFPNTGVIDELVKFLKRKGCWRRYGRSLRLLNKHWCLQLNQRMVAIHPDRSRGVGSGEFRKLNKFPHLTSLNVAVFFESQLADLNELGSILSYLRNLHHLEVSPGLLLSMREYYLMAMVGVTSLTMKDQVLDIADLEIMSCLPLRKLECSCCLDELKNMMSWFPMLEHLYANIVDSSADKSPDLKPLASLKSLKLLLREECNSLDYLSDVISLVSLSLGWVNGMNLEPLVSLPQLCDLESKVFHSKPLDNNFVDRILSKLTSLRLLVNSAPPGQFTLDFVKQLDNLQSLSLENFFFPDMRLLENLSRLTSLRLKNVDIPCGNMRNFPAFNCLKKLYLIGLLDIEDISLDHSKLPKLTDLTIVYRRCFWESANWIARLTKLKTLTVMCLKNEDLVLPLILPRFAELANLKTFRTRVYTESLAQILIHVIKQLSELETLELFFDALCQ